MPDPAIPKEDFKSWCVIELMGHLRLAGLVTEVELFGSKLGRVDIPNAEGGFTTQFFGGGSVYRISAVTEEVARAIAARADTEPVHRWELPRQIERVADAPLDVEWPDGDDGAGGDLGAMPDDDPMTPSDFEES